MRFPVVFVPISGLILLAIGGCGGGGGGGLVIIDPVLTVGRIEIQSENPSSLVGDPIMVSATVFSTSGNPIDTVVVWSSNRTEFQVRSEGRRAAAIFPLVVGEAAITAAVGTVTATRFVTSRHRIPSDVRMEGPENATVGTEFTVRAVPLLDPTHDMSASWTLPFVWSVSANLSITSQNPDSGTARVRATAPGPGVITATTGQVAGSLAITVQ